MIRYPAGTTPLEKLMLTSTPDGDCLLWDGARSGDGYGKVVVDTKQVSVHRLSYELHYGPIPAGLLVCHKCDVPLCINPDHLFLGTPKQNTHDSVNKGRWASGVRNGMAKLNIALAEQIRKLHAEGRSIHQLARDFSVARPQIKAVIRRIRWVN